MERESVCEMFTGRAGSRGPSTEDSRATDAAGEAGQPAHGVHGVLHTPWARGSPSHNAHKQT